MATYDEIIRRVRRQDGFVPKTCWIAHVKELNDIPVGRALNRVGRSRMVPCPDDKRQSIERAFRHFGMI